MSNQEIEAMASELIGEAPWLPVFCERINKVIRRDQIERDARIAEDQDDCQTEYRCDTMARAAAAIRAQLEESGAK